MSAMGRKQTLKLHLLSSSPRKRVPSRLQGRKPQALRQVAPAEVVALDRFQLPAAEPFLDALFAHDGVLHGRLLLEPDEAFDRVLAGEAVEGALAVLVDALEEVRGDARVDRAVLAVGEEVDCGLEVRVHP